MKITLNLRKPRNPLVAASLRRKAGAHAKGNGAKRLAAKRSTRQDLRQLMNEQAPPMGRPHRL